MPLNRKQISQLNASILGYGFPPVYFDFVSHRPVNASSMTAVETAIRTLLVSPGPVQVQHGLANVLYWGYAQIGYGCNRVARFRNNVSTKQIADFQALLSNHNVPNLQQISSLRMPEFSGISFVSKILAFLSPHKYCVLDQQLARLADIPGAKALHRVTRGTQLRITTRNQAEYDGWRMECEAISDLYYGGRYRTVDIERGFFNMIQTNQLNEAQKLYAAA